MSTDFLGDGEAARWIRCFKQPLRVLYSKAYDTFSLLHIAGAFRRWRCVEAVLD